MTVYRLPSPLSANYRYRTKILGKRITFAYRWRSRQKCWTINAFDEAANVQYINGRIICSNCTTGIIDLDGGSSRVGSILTGASRREGRFGAVFCVKLPVTSSSLSRDDFDNGDAYMMFEDNAEATLIAYSTGEFPTKEYLESLTIQHVP